MRKTALANFKISSVERNSRVALRASSTMEEMSCSSCVERGAGALDR